MVGTAAAETPLPEPGSAAWRSLGFPKMPGHTKYEVVEIDGTTAFNAIATCSASAMYVPAQAIDLSSTPVRRWRWKVEDGIDVGDERSKTGDDFAARVYVMFAFDCDNASLWERAKHAVAQRVYGETVPGNSLSYVWSSRAEVGSRWESPYTVATHVLVKPSGAGSGWVEEQADVVADYRGAFASEPTPLLSVAIMSDTDNTCQDAIAYFADLRLTAAGLR
jgi:hypothetical protein